MHQADAVGATCRSISLCGFLGGYLGGVKNFMAVVLDVHTASVLAFVGMGLHITMNKATFLLLDMSPDKSMFVHVLIQFKIISHFCNRNWPLAMKSGNSSIQYSQNPILLIINKSG